MATDPTIVAWLRKTRALANQLMVDPADVYNTLVEKGFTENRKRIGTERAVQMVVSLFRPEETLTPSEILSRLEKHEDIDLIQTSDLGRHLRALLSRNSDERGRKRFLRVKRGGYRLQLNNHELRAAVIEELQSQRQFVGSRRLMELFGVPYDRIAEVIGPMLKNGEVVSRLNSATENRDWCLSRYADTFDR